MVTTSLRRGVRDHVHGAQSLSSAEGPCPRTTEMTAGEKLQGKGGAHVLRSPVGREALTSCSSSLIPTPWSRARRVPRLEVFAHSLTGHPEGCTHG